MIVLTLASINAVLGQVPVDNTGLVFSFDSDGDGIDDILTGDGQFHVLIHHKGDISGNEPFLSGARVTHVFDMIDVVSAVIPDREYLEKVSRNPDVMVVEAQRNLLPNMDTSVPAVKAAPSDLYNSRNAHDLGFRGDDVTIAIVDSGVDNEHPMLAGSYVAGADFTIPSVDRDGSDDPDDRSGHGTAVASIALGRESNGTVGAAPEAGMIDLKVTTGLPFDTNPVSDELLLAIQWCMDNRDTSWEDGYEGVDVMLIAMDIGPSDGAVAQAVDQAASSGIVVVQSAGNSGTSYDEQTATSWPDGSIIVGGLDDRDTIDREDDLFWELSTSGPRTDDGDGNAIDELKPDVSAPAVGISFASYSRTSAVQPAEGMSQGTGSSYAAPHVAGTVALMLEANPSIAPSEGSNPVSKIIHASSEARGDPTRPGLSTSYNGNYGWGILDAYQAVLTARTYTGENHRPVITSFTAEPSRTTTGSTVRLTVAATDLDEDPLEYELDVDAGEYTGEGPVWEWTAPEVPGNYTFLATVTDPSGLSDQLRTSVEVEEGSPNRPPVITSFNADDRTLTRGESTRISVVAFDQDDDPLEYEYDTILGSITGSGDEVTYNAPMSSGTDTVSVRVTDPYGAADTRELTISITSDSSNSPPTITMLHLEPPVYNSSNIGTDVILTAKVEDPDGLDDISLVIADLSALGGSTGEAMADDGEYPDNISSDGTYSLLVVLPDPPMDGIYTITVTVVDIAGEESIGSIDLEIMIEPSGGVTGGTSSSTDTRLVVLILVIVVILVIAVVFLVLVRNRRRRSRAQQEQMANLAKVRYRQSVQNFPQQPIQAGPPRQGTPKFNVVSGR